jgi:hypothetical protein
MTDVIAFIFHPGPAQFLKCFLVLPDQVYRNRIIHKCLDVLHMNTNAIAARIVSLPFVVFSPLSPSVDFT